MKLGVEIRIIGLLVDFIRASDKAVYTKTWKAV